MRNSRLIAGLVFGGATLLTGCATSVNSWSKENANQAQTDQDLAECRYQSHAATAGSRGGSHDGKLSTAVGEGIGDGINDAEDQIKLTNECMQVRGYRPAR